MAALIVVSSVMNGFEGQLKGRILGVIPHAVLSEPDGRLSHWQTLAAALPKQPHELARAPLIRGEVMAQSPGELTALSLMGIDPDHFPASDRLAQQLGAEQLARLSPGYFNIIVGSSIARRLTLLPGDQVRLLSSYNFV